MIHAAIRGRRFKPPANHCPFVINAKGLRAGGSRHIDNCVFAIDASYEPMSHRIRIDVVSDDGARVQTLLRESTLAGGRSCALRVKCGDLAAGNYLFLQFPT